MAPRTDEQGRAYKKSQLQIQLWVNRRRKALTAAVLEALPSLAELDPYLTWVSPLESERFAEYHDAGFVLAIERFDLMDALAEFWPAGGPHWDALAIARDSDGRYLGPVLVEAKSYPGEMRSKLSATDPESRRRISERLAETRTGLGITDDYAEAWSNRYYQAANRYAVLRWFREVVGERAWLANVYFLDDPDHPTTRKQWDQALVAAAKELGLAQVHIPDSGPVFLVAGERDELLKPATEEDEPRPFGVSPFLERGDYVWPHMLEPMTWSCYLLEDASDDNKDGRVLRVEWSPRDGWQVWLLRLAPGSPPRWGATFEHDRLLRSGQTLADLVQERELPDSATRLYPALQELLTLSREHNVARLLWDWSPGNLGMDHSLKLIAITNKGEHRDLATTMTLLPDESGVLVVTERSVEETMPEAVEKLRKSAS